MPAEAASLSAPPFEVDLAPSPWRVGEGATLTLAGHAGDATPDRVDVYIVRFPGRAPISRFLTPSGVWSDAPAPYRQGVTPGTLSPVVAAWREEGPVGWSSVFVVFVRTAADPRQRDNWRFRPIVTKVSVLPPAGLASAGGALLLPAGALTLLAAGIVAWAWRRSGR